MLGVTRQRIDQLTREPGFPAPEVTLTSGRVWSREAILAWARGARRKVVQPGPDPSE